MSLRPRREMGATYSGHVLTGCAGWLGDCNRCPNPVPGYNFMSRSQADKTFYREVALNSQKILNGLMDSAAKDGAVTVL